MNRISLRLRIAILTGIIVMVSSLLTSFYSISSVRHSVDSSADTIVATIQNQDIKDESEHEKAALELDEYFRGVSSFEENIIPIVYGVMNDLKSQFNHDQLLFSGCLSLVGMLVSYYISGLILRPIKTLANEISSIRSDDFGYQIKVKNKKDVLGILATRFNELLKRLNDYGQRQKEFSSNVAHELKTPVAVMKASLQILDEDSSLQEYKETFKIQEKNIDRLSQIVDDLLMFKEEEFYFEEVSLKALMLDVINEYKSEIDEKEISLKIDADDVCLWSNEAMMHHIISNLLSNAIRYNKVKGSIYIEIKEDYLSVRDTGIGMEAEHLEAIFEPLYCIDKSRSRDLGGSGLGLALLKNICDKLEYTIDVSSKINYGSEFVIHFRKR